MPIELGFILQRLAEMAEADAVAARHASRGRPPASRTTPGSATSIDQALPRRRQRREGADGRHPPGVRRHERRRLRGRPPTLPARRQAPDARAARSTTAATCRWSSCCATSRRTGSRTTSPRAATATSCDRSPRTIYGIPPERVIGSSTALRYLEDERRRHGRLRRRAGRLRRRPGEAGPHLEPDRPPADPRRRQLQRRHPDAALRRRRGPARRCGCSSSTTTPSASSTTRRAPRSRSDQAAAEGWTVVSVKNDWSTVFSEASPGLRP